MNTTPQCGDCQLFAGRCVHVNGRRAATSTTPVEGCGYYAAKAAPLVLPAEAQTAAGLVWSHCPKCSTIKPEDKDGLCRCYTCGMAWRAR